MAKYTVTAGCGHTTEINLQGSVKERHRRLDWMESPDGMCNPCYAQMKRAGEADQEEREVQQMADKLISQYDALPEDERSQVLAKAKADLGEYKQMTKHDAMSNSQMYRRAKAFERAFNAIEGRTS